MKAPGIRIASGSLKGRKLEVPSGIRPTEQKVKEALCSRSGATVSTEATVLDLFAGSGAVAIEAMSRGAFSATLVESEPLGGRRPWSGTWHYFRPGASHLLAQPVERALSELLGRAARFDLVFADPPYSWVPDAGVSRRLLCAPAGRGHPHGRAQRSHRSPGTRPGTLVRTSSPTLRRDPR